MSYCALWLLVLITANGALLGLLIALNRIARDLIREAEELRAAAAREFEQALNSKADRGRACMPARVPDRSQ